MAPVLGLASGTVRVVPYDPRWPELFAFEAIRIRAALGEMTLAIEHTGSTAVPGLAAKPVVDLLAGYSDPATLPIYIRALQRAGYEYRGTQGIPDREFFRRGQPRSYHLHLTGHGSAFWQAHLQFRDALRGSPSLRDEYAALKIALAAQHPTDREAYIAGKTAFVARVLALAGQGGA
jgi:GrpB-like predicted nucleotidyltransferase (UPF0157 family)